ncbi:uncharacterized protein LOC144955208, partial [Lampetra fluviatilis]
MSLHGSILRDLGQQKSFCDGDAQLTQSRLEDLAEAMEPGKGTELLVGVLCSVVEGVMEGTALGSPPQQRLALIEAALKVLLTHSLTSHELREELAHCGGVNFLVTLLTSLERKDE